MVVQDRARYHRFRLMHFVLAVGGTVLLAGHLQAQTDRELTAEESAKPGTSAYHKPDISDAKLVAWAVDNSIRAYYFETGQQAESFTETIRVFQIATPFKLVISDVEQMTADYDAKKIVMPSNFADQLARKNQVFVLLDGTRRQHAQLESVMRAVGRH